MELFLDSVAQADIEAALKIGMIDGATTNPALLSQLEVPSYRAGVEKIVAAMGPGRKVFAEVLALDAEGMVKEGKEMAGWGPNMVIKLPATNEGLAAVRELSAHSIDCLVTMVYSPAQAIMAAKAGAKYVAVFVARGYQAGIDGIGVISEAAKAFAVMGTKCGILAASLRTPTDFVRAIAAGASSAALPGAAMLECGESPCTKGTLTEFLHKWNCLGRKGIF